MKAVLKIIRILVVIFVVKPARCQDGYNDQDILRIQKMASNDGDVETITSYSTNIIQRDPNSQSVSSVSVYQITDDDSHNNNYHRTDRTRNRKVFRIKNPFHTEDNTQQQDVNAEPQDSDTGASNQYAAVQYSLPPEEFLQQIRENQYYQQQQQISTPAPNLSYTATPQPQLQYSTIASSNFDNRNQLSNQPSYLEPKSLSHSYISSPNSYQFSGQNTYSIDSTPSPVTSYLSTSFPSSQFVGTPSNSYVSSSSPMYLSSPSNIAQYVSSPISNIQSVSSDYGTNRVTSTIGSNSLSYDNNDHNKKMQIDHYDNSAIGVRYPSNIQQQLTNEFVSSTAAPSSSLYPDSLRDWQNTMNANINALSKSLHEVSMTQYQHYPYNNNNQDTRSDSNAGNDNMSSDMNRVGNTPSANNMYMNYAQPDYQAVSTSNPRTRDLEQETGQSEFYSNGDYGWKMSGKKPLVNYEVFQSGNQARYQTNSNSDGAVSQMNFQMDTSRPYSQNSKSSTDSKETQDFAKAAAKAHEQYKQQQLYANNYAANVNNNNNQVANSAFNGNAYYGNTDKSRIKYTDNSNNYMYTNSQSDLITASPYYYSNSREHYVDSKNKQPFDHAKALKNIVPIDVSNVVSNSESQPKNNDAETHKFNIQNYNKDQDQNVRTYYRPIVDSNQKDKHSIYDYNFRNKPDEYLVPDSSKHVDLLTYYGKQQSQEPNNIPGSYSGISTQQNVVSPVPNNYQDNVQSLTNIQPGLQRPQNQIPTDIASILKLNDIPYRLTQGQIPDSSRSQNNNFEIPNSLPGRINQNVGSHQIDVTNILNKLMLSKQSVGNINRPEVESQGTNLLSTINGYKVANPFNVDLKLVADLLRNKPSSDESHLLPIRDQMNRQPIKFDLSQLQYLLNNDNSGNLASLSDGLSVFNNPYLDIYNSGRFPYQGVKYSRSQEEEESLIPIADASNNHPIGAVIEQDDTESAREGISSEMTAHGEEGIVTNFEDNRPKNSYNSAHRVVGDRYHPNSLSSGRHSHQRKYPKTDMAEPYPLLKPPPRTTPNRIRSRGKIERHSRRRHVNKPKLVRILKSEPLFEADSDDDDDVQKTVPILLRPPPVAEAKSDNMDMQSS